jgi:hypothetical protein
MKLKELFERVDTTPRVPQTRYVEKLYYGCCHGDALSLDQNGFNPSTIGRKALTLVSTIAMAKRMASQRNCEAIVEIKRIPSNYIQIDFAVSGHPDDIWEAIDRVNDGEEIVLKLVEQLPAGNFTYLNKLRRNKY